MKQTEGQRSMLNFTPATDSLGTSAPLDHRATFPLLGVPLEVRSNSATVIAIAERAFRGWRGLEPDLIEPIEPRVVTIVVQADDGRRTTDDRRWMTDDGRRTMDDGRRTTDDGPTATASHTQHATRNTQFMHRVDRGCFLATDGASLLTAQIERGLALGFVTPELVADESRFRHYALELLALLLASQHDRTPVHAGAVVRTGRAVLLVGRSMAGKSTLCYACLRDGFQLLAEDVVYVSRRRGLRLWGVPWRIHLLPDAARYFAELADLPVAFQANGKLKLAVETAAFGADRPRRHVERAAVCLIERAAGAASALESSDPCILIEALSRDLESGFDLHGDSAAMAEALVAGGAYRLSVGSDLAGAVALLKELTDD